MIVLWTRIIPMMFALAFTAAVFGPAPLPTWGNVHPDAVAATYLAYSALLAVLAVFPAKAVKLQTPAAVVSALIGIGSLTSSLAVVPFSDLWSVVGAATGTFAIFGILFSWHWLMARFWFRIFPAHGYGPSRQHIQSPSTDA